MHHLNTFFIVTGAFGILLPTVIPSKSPQAERRIFWIGFLTASISAFFIAYPPDWKAGIVWALLASFTMIVRAYFSTSYIKIRGKVHAFHVEDSRPDLTPDSGTPSSIDYPGRDPAPDAYGGLGLTTAKKMWWLMVFLMALCALGVAEYFHFKDSLWSAALAAAVVVIIATALGHMDASWEYPIARRQRIQFGAASIITLGVFAVFYLGAYYAGKRWPWRNKRSLEYRAHPRHQKMWP
ncbi:hypothetical protein [Mycobacterium celatum]|uniref:hypothetical protein n=1 Tax=Mycobacterium celatum TaxID=28045 RepID=UPI000A583709|nr:hypothetical protein [Mycobacterium celatum]